MSVSSSVRKSGEESEVIKFFQECSLLSEKVTLEDGKVQLNVSLLLDMRIPVQAALVRELDTLCLR